MPWSPMGSERCQKIKSTFSPSKRAWSCSTWGGHRGHGALGCRLTAPRGPPGGDRTEAGRAKAGEPCWRGGPCGQPFQHQVGMGGAQDWPQAPEASGGLGHWRDSPGGEVLMASPCFRTPSRSLRTRCGGNCVPCPLRAARHREDYRVASRLSTGAWPGPPHPATRAHRPGGSYTGSLLWNAAIPATRLAHLLRETSRHQVPDSLHPCAQHCWRHP